MQRRYNVVMDQAAWDEMRVDQETIRFWHVQTLSETGKVVIEVPTQKMRDYLRGFQRGFRRRPDESDESAVPSHSWCFEVSQECYRRIMAHIQEHQLPKIKVDATENRRFVRLSMKTKDQWTYLQGFQQGFLGAIYKPSMTGEM